MRPSAILWGLPGKAHTEMSREANTKSCGQRVAREGRKASHCTRAWRRRRKETSRNGKAFSPSVARIAEDLGEARCAVGIIGQIRAVLF